MQLDTIINNENLPDSSFSQTCSITFSEKNAIVPCYTTAIVPIRPTSFAVFWCRHYCYCCSWHRYEQSSLSDFTI